MKINKQIYCFGEILLRLQAPKGFFHLKNLDVYVGGAETNVAIGLANLKHPCKMLSILPNNFLGTYLHQYLHYFNIDTQSILMVNKAEQGLYFVEKGNHLVKSSVTYARKNSAFALTKNYDYNFTNSQKGDFFHISGSSLLVSQAAFENALNLAKKAKQKGLIISFDFNYRSKLADYETAKKRYEPLLQLADLIFATKLDFVNIFKMEKAKSEEQIMKAMMQKYHITWIAHTNRKIELTKHQLQGVLYTKDQKYQSDYYPFEVFERIGSGDAFACGIIDGLIKSLNPQVMLENGIKLAIYKQNLLPEDHLIISPSELKQFTIKKNNQDLAR